MFNDIRIKTKLIVVLSILSALVLVVGASGFYSLNANNNSLKTVYDDRLVALGQLDTVIRLVVRNELLVAKTLSDTPEQIAVSVDAIEAGKVRAAKVWDDYMTTYLTPDESVLARQFAERQKKFLDEGLNPALIALRNKDTEQATKLLHEKLEPLFQPVRESMNALIQLQLDVGKAEYASSQNFFSEFRLLAGLVILASIVIAALMGYWLIRSISGPLNYAVHIAHGIAGGDLSQRIEVKLKDEAGELLQALSEMNQSLISIVHGVRSSTETIVTASSWQSGFVRAYRNPGQFTGRNRFVNGGTGFDSQT